MRSSSRINSLELRTAANSVALTAFDLVPLGGSSADCNNESVRVRVAKGASVSGTDLAKLYGSATPSLNSPLLLQGCTWPRASSNAIITVHFSSPPASVLPTTPAGFAMPSGASLDGHITLAWQDSTGEDAYVIEQVGSSITVPAAWAQANATSTTIYGLAQNTKYCFRISAHNSLGLATSSTNVCATTSGSASE